MTRRELFSRLALFPATGLAVPSAQAANCYMPRVVEALRDIKAGEPIIDHAGQQIGIASVNYHEGCIFLSEDVNRRPMGAGVM